MTGWDRFVETFFKPGMLAQLLARHPQGHAGDGRDRRGRGRHRPGARARLLAMPARLPAVGRQCADRRLRRCVPRAAAAGRHPAHLFRPPEHRHQPAELRRAVAGAVVRAGGVRRGDLLGGHHLHARRASGRRRAPPGSRFSQTLAYVVLPQAVRLGVPPLTNRTIAITKNTALGTVIGVGEILNQATTAQSFTGNATPLMMGAIAYIVLFVPVVRSAAGSRRALPGGGPDGAILDAVPQPRDHAARSGRCCCAASAPPLYLCAAGHPARARRRPAGRAAVAVRSGAP